MKNEVCTSQKLHLWNAEKVFAFDEMSQKEILNRFENRLKPVLQPKVGR